jgi:hypothetical protein
MNTLTRNPRQTMSVPCNHTYIEVDADGTIECTVCGLRNSLSEVDLNMQPACGTASAYGISICESMGETCRNGKTWDKCTCC